MKQGPVIEFWVRVLDNNLRLFVDGAEGELFRLICDRTLRWGKFKEKLPPFIICETGSPDIGLVPLLWKRDTLRKRRRGLVEKNLIFYSNDKFEYTVNMPGIWRELDYLFAPVFEGWEKYQISFNAIHSEFEAAGYPHDARCKVDDQIARLVLGGKNKSLVAKERKAKKMESKDPLHWTPKDVQHIIKRYCAEHDVPCNDRGFTGKDVGCARNFIKYCLEAEQDPKHIIYEAIRRYHEYRLDLKLSNGAPLTLPMAFDFQEFFRYRSQIINYILTERREYARTERKDNWKFTDLRGDDDNDEGLF